MNVNAIAGGALAGFGVHPFESATYYRCVGQSEDDSGLVLALYADPLEIQLQQRSEGIAEIRHSDNREDNEIKRNFFVNDTISGNVRVIPKSSDMILYRNEWWKVTAVPSDFRVVGWVLVTCTLQVRPPAGL